MGKEFTGYKYFSIYYFAVYKNIEYICALLTTILQSPVSLQKCHEDTARNHQLDDNLCLGEFSGVLSVSLGFNQRLSPLCSFDSQKWQC